MQVKYYRFNGCDIIGEYPSSEDMLIALGEIIDLLYRAGMTFKELIILLCASFGLSRDEACKLLKLCNKALRKRYHPDPEESPAQPDPNPSDDQGPCMEPTW